MSYKEKLLNINTFVFDVDGVLTDGTVALEASGELVRTCILKMDTHCNTRLKKDIIL